ncbi:MAG: zinc-dependent metalloprotease, partial [Dysgonamonadaceae bacterium]|nr:zinc-dependent metalloprotease [Dysgonamonadaceae bacterium]
GIGDDRTDDDKAKYLNFTINPSAPIQIKPSTWDDLPDELKNSSGYTPAGGENAATTFYIVTIEDADGNKHDIVVDALPATVTDAGGNTYTIDEQGGVELADNISQGNGSGSGGDGENDLGFYFIIKKIGNNENVDNKTAEEIVKTTAAEDYFSPNAKITLDEGRYICIPVLKNIKYKYNILDRETLKPVYHFVTKKNSSFIPFGKIANESFFRRLSWSENPFNRYDISHTIDGRMDKDSRYTVLDLKMGMSDTLEVKIHPGSYRQIADWNSDDTNLPDEISSLEDSDSINLSKIQIIFDILGGSQDLEYTPGKITIGVKKFESEAVWFDLAERQSYSGSFDGSYGIDIYDDQKLSAFKKEYDPLTILKSDKSTIDYQVPSVSTWSGEDVTIKAKIKESNAVTDSVYYKFESSSTGLTVVRIQCNGTFYNDGIFEAKNGNYELEITLNGSTPKNTLSVYDKNKKIVGKLTFYSQPRPTNKSNAVNYKVVNVTFGDTPQGTTPSEVDFNNYTNGSPLENYLNLNSFNQAFIQLNNNNKNKFDSLKITESEISGERITSTSFVLDSLTNNRSKIRDLLETKYKAKGNTIGRNERIIFLINNREMDQTSGFSNATTKSIAIFKSALTNWETLTHEMGHTFGLVHPFGTQGFTEGSSTNFMDYANKRNMFWYWQWKIINPTDF